MTLDEIEQRLRRIEEELQRINNPPPRPNYSHLNDEQDRNRQLLLGIPIGGALILYILVQTVGFFLGYKLPVP